MRCLLLEVLWKLPNVQKIISEHEPMGDSFGDLFLGSIAILTVCMGVIVIFLTMAILANWHREGEWTKKMTWLTALDAAMFIWVLLTFPIMGTIVGIITVMCILLVRLLDWI